MLIGLPGAGKSTLARALCRSRRFVLVDRDAIRLELFPAARFTEPEKAAATAEVWRRARRRLAAGESVVIDGMTFASRVQRERARRLARARDARCIEVFVECPVALAVERVARSRDHPAGDRDARLVRDVARRLAPVPRRVPRLDARASARAQLRKLAALL